MTRTTYADVKASRIPEALNVPSTDSRLIKWVNEAMQGMLNRGLWWGSYGRYSISVTSQLLTLPAEVDTIEAITVDTTPVPLRNSFYEFLGNGWGARDDSAPTGILESMYRGQYPIMTDVSSTPSVLKVKCDVALDVGKAVLILGYDASGNWVRTLVGGAWVDGESILLAQGAGTSTVTSFSKVTGIQAPSTLSGQWWLYQGSTLLGNYQYWETNPSYKRYLVPYLTGVTSTAIILGKRAFVPLKNDTDYLILGNLRALKLACMAVKAEENHDWQEANLLWNGGSDGDGIKRIGAIQELDFELQHHIGENVQCGITVENCPGYSQPVIGLQ